VSQIALWRRTGSPFVQKLTTRIFFTYLLPKYGCILSDAQQTQDGNTFWINRMAEATRMGLRVGLANMTEQKISYFDPTRSTYLEWLKANPDWGAAGDPGSDFQRLRYLISES